MFDLPNSFIPHAKAAIAREPGSGCNEVRDRPSLKVETSNLISDIHAARTEQDFEARLRFAHLILHGVGDLWPRIQTMRGPLRSADGLAPMCSMRRCQLAPR
jgi:hypothetical protein